MKQITRLKLNRYLAAVLATVLILTTILVFPGTAFSLGATISSSKASFKLGEKVSLTSSLFLNSPDNDPSNLTANLSIAGPQSFSQALPVVPGTYTYPGNNLKVTVSYPNSGYGYGYGYSYGTGKTATINYSIEWNPPILKDPPPETAPTLPGGQYVTTATGSYVSLRALADTDANDGTVWGIWDNYYTPDGFDHLVQISLSDGHLMNDFPLTNYMSVESLAYQGGKFYAVDNGTCCSFSDSQLLRINPGSGAIETTFAGPQVDTNVGSAVNNQIVPLGGLASDGSNLWGVTNVGVSFFGTGNPPSIYAPALLKINASNGSVLKSLPMVFSGPPPCPPCVSFNGGNALEFFTDSNGKPAVIAATGNQFWRFLIDEAATPFGKATFQAVDTFVPPISLFVPTPFSYDIQGLTEVNPLYFADSSGNIWKATNPGAPPTSPMINGDYVATFTVNTAASGNKSATANFSIDKLSAFTITIDTPANNSFSSVANVNIGGTVSDPTVKTLKVGVALPTTTLFEDNAEKTGPVSDTRFAGDSLATPRGLWHTSDLSVFDNPNLAFQFPPGKPDPFSDGKSWWFGKEDTGNFCVESFPFSCAYGLSQQVGGVLQLKDYINNDTTFALGDSAKLEFWTWYDTDSYPGVDRKYVMLQVQQPDLSFAQEPVAQIVDPGFFGFANPAQCATPGLPLGGGGPAHCEAITMSPSQFDFFGLPPVNGGWHKVTIDLTKAPHNFTNKVVKIQFVFDSFDETSTGQSYNNSGKGWFLDDINFTGSGFLGVNTCVGPYVNATGDCSGKAGGAWSTPFSLAEGDNTITVQGSNTYPEPFTLSASASTKVTLDATPPVLTLVPPPAVVGNASLTLHGTIVETNFKELDIKVNGVTLPPFTQLADQDNATPGIQFNANIFLFPGANDIVAMAKDKGNLCNTTPATSCAFADVLPAGKASTILDVTGPVISPRPTIYPIGDESARAGDLVVFQLKVTDAESGVASVTINIPGGSVHTFATAADIPQAVKDQWGIGDATHILPINMPGSAATGFNNFTVTATDNGGNVTTTSIGAQIVASLNAFNLYLLPDWNLVSTPLTLTDKRFDAVVIHVARLTNSSQSDVTPTWRPDSTQIAFASNRDFTGYHIFVMDANGSNVNQLTSGNYNDTQPSWRQRIDSNNPEKIAFTSDRDGNSEIYKMDTDGTNQVRMTNNSVLDEWPAFSPDGTKIAFVSARNGNPEIYVMNADGSSQTRLTTNSANDTMPAWASDGTLIFFSSNRDGNYEIYKMNTDGANQTRLTNNAVDDLRPTGIGSGAPGGAVVFFSNGTLMMMNADGSTLTLPGGVSGAIVPWTQNPSGKVDENPAASKDGRKVAFDSNRDGNLEIYVALSPFQDPVIASAIEAIWNYDPTLGWRVFTPDGIANDTLTNFDTGKGYWVFATRSKFKFSDPLASGLSRTPAPKKLTLRGQFLASGANAIPPIYPVLIGWNLMGYHSTNIRPVAQALQNIMQPYIIWGSLLRYDNFIKFSLTDPPQIVLGAYTGLTTNSSMDPGAGYWLYMNAAGNIVPTN